LRRYGHFQHPFSTRSTESLTTITYYTPPFKHESRDFKLRRIRRFLFRMNVRFVISANVVKP
jgi:hypothetical protein